MKDKTFRDLVSQQFVVIRYLPVYIITYVEGLMDLQSFIFIASQDLAKIIIKKKTGSAEVVFSKSTKQAKNISYQN